MLRRQSSRSGPGDWEHPIVIANASKFAKFGMGDAEVFTPENMMAERNGGILREFRREIASEMDMAPAE